MATRNATCKFRINLFTKKANPDKPCETILMPFNPMEFDDYLVTLKQYESDGEVNKTKVDCDTGENFIDVKLTQEESLKFDEDEIVKIQIQFFFNQDKEVIITNIAKQPFKEVLNETIHKWD